MDSGKNKRTAERYEYPYEQLLAAALPGGKLPPLADFERVACDDLSRGGIAFFLSEEPHFDECVVGLGQPPNITYVCARVTYSRPAIHRGRICFRVGCQFKERLRMD